MNKGLARTFLAVAATVLIGPGISSTQAGINPEYAGKKRPQEQVLRSSRLLDLQQNTVSNIRFFSTNYGIFGLNVDANGGGGFWPRSSSNQYIFGGGIWFAAQKRVTVDGQDRFNKLVSISYNPNSGNSWFVPGRVADGDELKTESDYSKKYRTYFSTDFGADGKPLDPNDGPNWPVWDTRANDTLKGERYLGEYVDSVALRTTAEYPKGPAFISEEDIFSVFKDTDLRYNENGEVQAQETGYPLKLDVEHTVYSWGFGQYKNFMFLAYSIINKSSDTLRECWMAPAMDMDIASSPNFQSGAANDRTRFYNEDPTLNMAVQWTNGDRGEANKGFGYIGFDFLESPILNAQRRITPTRALTDDERAKVAKYIDSVRPKFEELAKAGQISEADTIPHRRLQALTDKQLASLGGELYRPGLVTFRNWVIENDPTDDGSRYDFMSLGVRDGDDGAGDKRFLMATGPFDLFPGDTARVVVGLIIARTASGGDATGDEKDIEELVRVDRFAQRVYDDNFRTPVPPDRSNMTWAPINNGVVVQWDSASEVSIDLLEGGLDFMGYSLYRARRTDYDIDNQPYERQTRPFAWKRLADWRIPVPFFPSTQRTVIADTLSPYLDSLGILFSGSNPRRIGAQWVYNAQRFPNPVWADFFESMPDRGQKYLVGTIVVDTTKVRQAVSSTSAVYSYIQSGNADYRFEDIGKTQAARDFIVQYMDSITNRRTFIDLGDDNGNGVIESTDDLATTEKLINSVDYFYFLRAYDQGDVNILSPAKKNSPRTNQNLIKTTPLAAAAGKESEILFTISDEEQARLAGFYNFRFSVEDGDRLRQLFSGHELEVEFQPVWGVRNFPFTGAASTPYGIYGREITITDKTTKQELAQYNVFPEFMSEHAALFAGGNDSTGIGKPDTTMKTLRVGSISSLNNIYAPNQTVRGAFSFAFDYALQQWGGIYRFDTLYIKSGEANTRVARSNAGVSTIGQDTVDNFLIFRGYNNGPATYEVEFLPGGTETMALKYGPSTETKNATFEVPYLTLRVKNIVSYERPSVNGGIKVSYDNDVPHFTVTKGAEAWPAVRDVPIGQYNLTAYAWVNGRESDGFRDRPNQSAVPVGSALAQNTGVPCGTQGRYYLSSQNNQGDVVDFVHVFLASGGEFGLDFSNKAGRRSVRSWEKSENNPTKDFKEGDKVVLSTFGGALGLPEPGAKFSLQITDGFPKISEYTDSMLEQVRVVPNPYYVTHIGQTTTDAGKLYFTKLPPKCTIRIFNVVGELIRTLEHDDLLSSEKAGTHTLEVWNMISESQQQVASQTLIAQIETPNGAQSIVKFTIVVGGFRIVPE